MRGVGRVLLALLAGLAVAPALADSPKPCRVAGLRHEVLCGQVKRALDPAKPAGAHVDVHYVVVPALARRKLPDPVFLIAGGPGQSAIALAGSVMPLFSRLNNQRDVVFVDQRGTGRSSPLVCEEPQRQTLAERIDPDLQVKQLHECRERLQKLPYGDLRFFTTPIAMQDLDAVRQQLGAERINLVAASYGTRAALDYLRQFPQAVRRIVLDGVAPADMVLTSSVATDGQAAFDAMFAHCAQDATCQAAYPRLRDDWSTLLKRLPQEVTVQQPLTGQSETWVLTREMVLAAVRGPLYSPLLAQALPEAIHQAAGGRVQALLSLGSALLSRKNQAPAMGMHFSVVCAEDLPRAPQSTDVPGTDFGPAGARLYQRVCAEWPRGELPAAYYAMPPSPVPVLLLSGGIDPVTPPRHGTRVAQALGRNAKHVVVPHAGHGVMSLGCMPEVMQRFTHAADESAALAVDAACAQSIPRPTVFRPVTLEMAP